MSGKGSSRERLVGKFRAITRERIARLDTIFGQLERSTGSGGDPVVIDELMREIHTLKGESRLMGFLHLNDLAHRTEDLLAWAQACGFQVPGRAANLVYEGFDLILAHVAEDSDQDALAARRSDFLSRAEHLIAGLDPAEPPAPAEPASSSLSAEAEDREAPAEPVGRGLGDFIRVPASSTVYLTELVGRLLLHQDATARLVQLLWQRAREVGSGGGAGELVDIIRTLREEVFETQLRTEDLQDAVRHLRLIALSSLFERYPAAIRELARERGKEVRVVLEGGDVAVDKQILDVIDEAILHLVRNGVDHGLEPAAERALSGKPEHGTIQLSARQVGSRVEIAVGDDGRGISPAAVRAAAVDRGILLGGEAAALGDEAALELLYRPGFSTRAEVSDVSGRGVGLDVVSDRLRSVGGSINLQTRPGQGTTFTLTVPVSAALLRVLCFTCGDVIFAVPSASIHRVLRTGRGALERAGAGQALELEGEHVPLIDLRKALGQREQVEGELEVVVVEHGMARVALAVGGFVGERQVVQRSVGALLAGVRLLSGAGILEKGHVALILSVPELVRRWGEGQSVLQEVRLTGDLAPPRRIMVVDDSELTRDMLVALARRASLEVTEAVNGREALVKMRGAPPDLLLTDLDMPVMDGFQLLAQVRADAALRQVPVVVLSTRGSDEDKRRAMAAGADAYLVKSDFTEEALGATVTRLLGERER
jgi:chemotaxis protein histidine kinase CheA/ActR/RegA family two-component response regulator